MSHIMITTLKCLSIHHSTQFKHSAAGDTVKTLIDMLNLMEVSWQFAFVSPSNTASVLLQCVLNILDVTQLGRTHTQQLAAKCRAEANISSSISDDTGQGAGGVC